MSTKLDRLTELAKEEPKRQFFSIAHLITPEALYAAFRSLRKEASAGVDGVPYQEDQPDAEREIHELYQRLKDGKYPPNRCAGSTYRRRMGSRDRSRFPLRARQLGSRPIPHTRSGQSESAKCYLATKTGSTKSVPNEPCQLAERGLVPAPTILDNLISEGPLRL
jgi:hypothetical protein